MIFVSDLFFLSFFFRNELLNYQLFVLLYMSYFGELKADAIFLENESLKHSMFVVGCGDGTWL